MTFPNGETEKGCAEPGTDYKFKLKMLAEKLESVQELNNSLKQQLNTYVNENEKIRTSISEYQTNIKNKDDKIKHLSSKLRRLEANNAEIGKLKNENNDLRNKNSSLVLENAEITMKQKNSELKCSTLLSEVNLLNEKQISLEQENRVLCKNAENAKEETERLISNKSIDLASFKSKCRLLELKKDKLEVELEKSRVDCCMKVDQKELELSKEKNSELKNGLIKMREEISGCNTKLSDLKNEYSQKCERNEKLEKSNKNIKMQLQNLLLENKSVRVASERRLEEIESLCIDQKTQIKKKDTEIEFLKERINQLENSLEKNRHQSQNRLRYSIGDQKEPQEADTTDLVESFEYQYLKNILISFLVNLPLNEQIAKQLLPVIASIMGFSAKEKEVIEKSWEDFLLWGLNKPIFIDRMKRKK